ncbi:MAG TPA: ATP-binding protein, partial [Sporichthya sp.]|nr:ATP-binding protein [Sporichthya sp.]
DATVVIRVVDHGPGVPAGDRERIFAPFQQVGDRHTGAGVGLGLAVARGFVEALGGRLNAAETPGGGLTMRVELPMAPATRMRAGAVP